MYFYKFYAHVFANVFADLYKAAENPNAGESPALL